MVSAKICEEMYKELILRVPEGERSEFIREAILEKLAKTPRAVKILNLEKRVERVEKELGDMRKYLSDLEFLTYGQDKINPHQFCIDELEHKIIEYLLHYKGATTPELAEYLKVNRWIVLNRLRRIQKSSKKQLGKPVINYCGGKQSGKKKAWWINEKIIIEDSN